MKRTVLCFFSLLLLLLVFCTLVSPKAEEEMQTLVQVKKGEAKNNRHLRIGNVSLEWENSQDRLFLLTEGSGWEDGPRISVLTSEYFDRYETYIELGPGTAYRYVFSASREPVSGGAVRVVEPVRGEDSYLIWYPEAFSGPDNLTNVMEVVARTDNAVLIRTKGATFPFFEHNMWYRFKGSVGDAVRIFSLHDIEQFVQALPRIAGIAAILLCSLLLWGACWILPDRKGGGRGVWIANGLLIAALFAALPRLLGQFDLPASLLPRASILDIPHYAENFRRIAASMDALGVPTVRDWLSTADRACARIVGAGVLITGAIIAAERVLCRRRR